MLKTMGVVQSCFQSPRFRANATRRLGGQPLLEWVVRRVTDSIRLDGVIVVACDAAEHCWLSKLVPLDVPVFLSDHPDAMVGLLRALEEYRAEAVVRVHGDNPFIDPA